jgi:hypothetical protein
MHINWVNVCRLLNRYKACVQSGHEHGSILFTAVADDPYTEQYERERRVSTSKYEEQMLGAGAASDEHNSTAGFTLDLQQEMPAKDLGSSCCSLPHLEACSRKQAWHHLTWLP